jgi:hypothetical protein
MAKSKSQLSALSECPAASEASLASGTGNRATPQTRQINTVGNNQTPGLFTFLSPLKCSIISLSNSTGLPTRHDGHNIRGLSLMIHPAFEADHHSEYICAIWLPTRFSLVAAKTRFAAHEDRMLEGVGDKSTLSTYLFLRFGSILSNNFAATRNRA